MESFLKKCRSIKSLKKKSQSKLTVKSFDSESDSNSNNDDKSNTSNITNSSNKNTSRKMPIIPYNNSPNNHKQNDENNIITYSKKILSIMTDITNNIFQDYNNNSSKGKAMAQNYNNNTFLKPLSQLNNKNINNKNNNINSYDVSSKNAQLRNFGFKLNSGDFSIVKEEQEKKCSNLNNVNNNNNNNNINSSNQHEHDHDEQYKIQIFYEGKYLELMINKNAKFKKLILLIQKKLLPYYQITNYDILYKLKTIDILQSFNMKIIEIIGDLPYGASASFLLKKKIKKNIKNEDKKVPETSVSIRNFPSLTDLAIDLNYFFKKETRESDFFVDYKKNICKVTFSYPEKAFSLVSFLSKLKLKKPIYKRLRVNLDYKLDVVTNVNQYKHKSPKIMLPFLNKDMINNLKSKNKDYYIKDPNRSPLYSYGRKNIKLIIPKNFSFSFNKNRKNYNNKYYNNKTKIEDIFFLHSKKDKENDKHFYTINTNSTNNIKIMSYKSKDKHNTIVYPNNKNNDNEIMSPKRVRRSSFFNPIINLKNSINDKNHFNFNLKKENNDKNPLSNTSKMRKNSDILLRSWSNMDKLKSKMINKKESENKLKNEKNENIHNIQPTGIPINNNNNNINIIINDKENEKVSENKNDINLMELLKEAKVSDDSSVSSEEKSVYDDLKKKKSNKYLFKSKKKRFMFFKGLTKRAKRKHNEYIGKKS